MSTLDCFTVPPQRLAESVDPPAVLLVTSDGTFARQIIQALGESVRRSQPGGLSPYHFPLAASLAQAQSYLGRLLPLAIFLDDRVAAPRPVEDALLSFSKLAPLVILADAEFPARLSASPPLCELVSRGRLECVVRIGEHLPLLVRLIERHAGHFRSRDGSSTPVSDAADRDAGFTWRNFGEMLRHEVNNPLTGILGNAELLLARCDRLPVEMAERLATIADLAIRLRETIRRLSNTWDQNSDSASLSTADDVPRPRGARRAS